MNDTTRTETPTPRTDGAPWMRNPDNADGERFVPADFARTLERENAALRQQAEQLAAALEFSVTALATADTHCPADTTAEQLVRTAIDNSKAVLAHYRATFKGGAA